MRTKAMSITRFTTDSVPKWHALTRDEVLEAQTPHKAIASGLVWEGDLRPKLDMLIERAGKLHGFMVNHVVGPEPSPIIDQMLGRVWRGIEDIRSDLKRSRVADDLTDPVDTSEALAAVEQLRQSLGTEEINISAVHDSITNLKRARDAVKGSNAGTRAMNDARRHPMIMPRRTYGDFSKPVSNADLNQRSRKFWAARNNRTETNDGHIQIRHPLPVDGGQSRPRTPAEINEANRRHWAGR